MRPIRRVVNAILMVTLVKPIVRLMVGRWRKRAQETAPAVISVPVQGLFEAALLEELSPRTLEAEPGLDEALAPAEDGRSIRSLLIVAGVLAAVTILVALAATVVRRRREASEAQADGTEWVAVPIEAEAETEEAEESLVLASAAE